MTSKLLTVHRDDAEGALLINADTGLVTQPLNERPDWADGLTCALIAERAKFYTDRLGPVAAESHLKADIINYADLGWITIDEDGSEVEIEADAEHRMDAISKALGVDRTTGEVSGHVVTEIEMHLDRAMTHEEHRAFEAERAASKQAVTG